MSTPPPAGAGLFFSGSSATRRLRRQDHARRAGGVLERRTGDIGPVDDPSRDQITVLLGHDIEAAVRLALRPELLDDHAAPARRCARAYAAGSSKVRFRS